jgi:hypothetical protein
LFFAAALPDEASARRRRRRTRRAGRRARARGHRGDASGFRGVGTSLVFVSVFFLFRLVFRESARRTSRAVFASVRLEVGPPFVSRRLYAEATGTARSKAGAAKTLEASLYRRRDDERILLVDVGNAFDFLHPRARASKAASRRRASSRVDTSFTRTDPHSTPMTGS